MPKINVLRVVTCFYPGNIQLPAKKIYPFPSNNESEVEWLVIRNFKALNIIDYRHQLNDLLDNKSGAGQTSYAHKKGNTVIRYDVGGLPTATAEIVDITKEKLRNVDRFSFDAPVSELMLLQYYYKIDLPVDPNQESVPHDFTIVANIIKQIINIYIKGSGDWTISSPNFVNAPMYYEAIDIYFDEDVPKDEMRNAYFKKTDKFRDLFSAIIDVNGLESTLNKKIILDLQLTNNSVIYVTNNQNDRNVNALEIFTQIRRDIYMNKNYKYALLEAFTFAEAFITDYLTEHKLSVGISKSKISDFEKEIGISYKLNIELPLILKLKDEEKEIIGGVEAIRKIRNKIIHGQSEMIIVSEAEAVQAVSAVQKLYLFLSDKKS